jgi:hypothetical protein
MAAHWPLCLSTNRVTLLTARCYGLGMTKVSLRKRFAMAVFGAALFGSIGWAAGVTSEQAMQTGAFLAVIAGCMYVFNSVKLKSPPELQDTFDELQSLAEQKIVSFKACGLSEARARAEVAMAIREPLLVRPDSDALKQSYLEAWLEHCADADSAQLLDLIRNPSQRQMATSIASSALARADVT